MTKDMNKGITSIAYNSLNLPRRMDIKSPVAEARNEYVYSAGGQKLKVIQKWNPNYSTTPVIGSAINTGSLTMKDSTDYVGNKIYENGALKRILVDGGYIEGGVYHFFMTDHLGNNRVVANASGAVIQRNHYYPFGSTFGEVPNAEQGKQSYKYNGKELDRMHGLNLYDYSARYYEPALGRFTSVDPHAEKYYSMSPYVYCGNNPMRFIDPTGMDNIVYNQKGELSDRFKMDGNDRLYMLHEKGEQGVLRVLSQESITGDPREKKFDGTLNESFFEDAQAQMIADGVAPVDGYMDLIKESNRGSLDYKSKFKAGELINLNGIYMNNHEALNYMWGASMSELTRLGKVDVPLGDAMLGAQAFHMYDKIFGRSEGWKNQPNHTSAIVKGYLFNDIRTNPHIIKIYKP